jgi:EmrB/QacA subfamily drug resistance transporter
MQPTAHSRRWWILVLIGIAQLMVVLDATIVNIALPSAQEALGFADADRQWVVTGYALAFGSLLLLGGRLGDLFGRKPAFVAGLVGFAVASAIGGAAQSFEVLVGARVLQGAFGALLAPAALSLLSTTFSHSAERGKAFAIYGAIAGGGGAIGLLLGGILTEYLSWRWCLYVNLFIAVPAAIAAVALLSGAEKAAQPRVDIRGALAAAAGVFGIVYGCAKADTLGWGDPVTLGFLLAGALLLAAFVALQRRGRNPLLPLRVVADRNRGGAFAAVGFVGLGMFGVFLFLTYYLQRTLGFSPVQTGLAFLPMVAMVMGGAGAANVRMLPRVGPRPLVSVGMLLAAAGMLLLTRVDLHSTYAGSVLPALLIVGLGFGFVMSTAMNTATLGVAPDEAGVASAMVNTMQQVGGSIGTAVLSTLAADAATAYVGSHAPGPATLAQAAIESYTTAFGWAAVVFAVAAVVCGALMRPGRPAPAPTPDGVPVMVH